MGMKSTMGRESTMGMYVAYHRQGVHHWQGVHDGYESRRRHSAPWFKFDSSVFHLCMYAMDPKASEGEKKSHL